MDGTLSPGSVRSPNCVLHSPGSMFPECPLFHLLEASASKTAFHSVTATAPFRKPPRVRSSLPAYLFRATLNSRLARSAANSRPRVRSISQGRSTLTTRCQFTIQNSQAYRSRPLPIRMFVLLDCSAPLTSDPRGLPSCWPDIPFTPRDRRSRIHRPFPGSTLQVRYLQQACCSVYLLEPPSECTRPAF